MDRNKRKGKPYGVQHPYEHEFELRVVIAALCRTSRNDILKEEQHDAVFGL